MLEEEYYAFPKGKVGVEHSDGRRDMFRSGTRNTTLQPDQQIPGVLGAGVQGQANNGRRELTFTGERRASPVSGNQVEIPSSWVTDREIGDRNTQSKYKVQPAASSGFDNFGNLNLGRSNLMETDSQAPDLVKGSNSGLSFGPQIGDMELASSTASRGGVFTKVTPAGENPWHRGDEIAKVRFPVVPGATHAQATVKRTDLQVKWGQEPDTTASRAPSLGDGGGLSVGTHEDGSTTPTMQMAGSILSPGRSGAFKDGTGHGYPDLVADNNGYPDRVFALQHDETSRIDLIRMLKDDLVKNAQRK